MKRVSINFDYVNYYFLSLFILFFTSFQVTARNVLPSSEKLDTMKAPKKIHEVKKMNKPTTSIQTAILAGGCFWGVEELFRNLPGVVSTEVGYTGGIVPNPTYEIVKQGTSGHAESIKIEFDSSKLSYEDLLKFFFKIHDPTTKNQQGNDIGSQYRSAIFFESEEQHKSAQKIKELVEASGAWKKPLVTEIVKASTFYSAENFHQDYLKKNPGGYTCHYIRDVKF
ncbi:MAG: peptide-methionine (S)-S-oxide reductase MsrA [Bdellovibrionaceae bacterium]|nr:peptide-methionine (S)-S-oxide reductase MsrA [Bacteriovoracaceae bacterium]MCK6596733.1 peptide-methionine (S)-S-oxide reductase MsrA [Pseudobdellovibrionaceae bacterium]NUM58527.1 peptide-methionine (S)-S-oxide reductase MsrA [Pseudobdellovibrionaceae bacterium]